MNVNYQLELDKIINENLKQGKTPSLLLHVCCAPCSSYVLEYLSKYFKITVFYYNPNISSFEEYSKRKEEVKRFLKECSFTKNVNFIEIEYENDVYEKVISGLEMEKEGGSRCERCFNLRLEKTCKYALENNFDYFTTSLSISPYKNAKLLNEIGAKLSNKYGVAYLYSDFKKRNGYKRSIELSHIYNLYRQDFCGCKYSKKTD